MRYAVLNRLQKLSWFIGVLNLRIQYCIQYTQRTSLCVRDFRFMVWPLCAMLRAHVLLALSLDMIYVCPDARKHVVNYIDKGQMKFITFVKNIPFPLACIDASNVLNFKMQNDDVLYSILMFLPFCNHISFDLAMASIWLDLSFNICIVPFVNILDLFDKVLYSLSLSTSHKYAQSH